MFHSAIRGVSIALMKSHAPNATLTPISMAPTPFIEGTAKFERVPSHTTVRERLRESSISCTKYHGIPHPTGEERTPGHPAYDIREPR